MANYKERAISGTRWKRAARVQIDNPVGDGKSITFIEEIATLLDDGAMNNTPAGQVLEVFTDPAEQFQLVNPADDSPIAGKTASYGEVYQLLHSLYLHLSAKRDTAEAAAAAAAIVEV